MQYNRELIISSAGNRKTITWTKQKIFWAELVERLKSPLRSSETLDEYLKFSKSKQDDLKDVGGFVGGELKNNKRRDGVIGRDLIALDLDNIEAGQTQNILKKIDGLGCAFVVYSTRKHCEYKPRLRVLFPTDRTVTAEEYEPIARKLASMIGISLCDPTTFQVERLMYWPSCSADSQYVYTYADKEFLNADGILKMYSDWKNILEWPQVPGADKSIERLRKKQENPLEKKGIVGAFCKTYNILEAIEKFIPGAYETCDIEGRLTYTGGSTFGGAILYEDGLFLYSHHATDPASMKLCNAFDLIRLHKFGAFDDEAKEGTPTAKLPSFSMMSDLALSDKEVKGRLSLEKMQQVGLDFKPEDLSWINLLEIDGAGNYAKTRKNIITIFENDSNLKGKIAYDEFANRGLVLGVLPWNFEVKKRNWQDVDDAQLRIYLETVYGITGDGKISDALMGYSHNNKINEVQDYLKNLTWDGTKRIDTLLTEYLGAEDNAYTRAVIRKSLVAAVARAMEPGVKWDYMPILAGPQGIGKSTFLQLLGKDWFSDSLQSFEGKDASEMIQGTWINEIGELTVLTRSETNAVKQFLSKKEDIFREAYGRKTGRFPRRCIFFGTSNDMEFLKDKTGNRRFWPVDLYTVIPVKSVFNDLPSEIDQLWAEAFVAWEQGEELFLTGEAKEIAEMEQDNHRESNAKEGLILEFLEKEIPVDWYSRELSEKRLILNGNMDLSNVKLMKRTKICAIEIWCECFGSDPRYMQRKDSIEINGILDTFKEWKKCKKAIRFGSYGHQRGYEKI